MKELCIVFNCFFNTDHIERTLESIKQSEFPCDIIMLENPSKYSEDIRKLRHKYDIYKYLICNDNIESAIFELFSYKYYNLLQNYKFIAFSECDVVLDKNALHEIVDLLTKSSDKVAIGSVDLHMYQHKYYNLPIYHWVPQPKNIDGYSVGPTGFQFIVFKQNTLLRFIDALKQKKLCGGIALGQGGEYYGISDTNLTTFIESEQKLWIRTVDNRLDHIGWEHYIENNNEYVQLKAKNLAEHKIRCNLDLSKYTLIELQC